MRICVFGSNSDLAKEFIYHRRNNEIIRVDRSYSLKHYNGEQMDAMVTFPGTIRNSKLVNMSMSDWRTVIEDTLNSVAGSLIEGLPKIRDGGTVVVVGSIVGSLGGYGCSNYAAAKSGLVGLVRSAANEMIERRISVNLLELGYVDIGMGARLDEKTKERVIKTIPMKRFAHVNEVLRALDFLLNQTYMTGNVLTFAGGLQ